MKLVLASDHAGFNLKKEIFLYLKKNYSNTYEILDLGCECNNISVDYPVYAKKVAEIVSSSNKTLGILFCGTGSGMCIVANKFKGVRATNAFNSYLAKMARAHNNSNILCLGSRVLGIDLAINIVSSFLSSSFESGRHQKRIDILKNIEEDIL